MMDEERRIEILGNVLFLVDSFVKCPDPAAFESLSNNLNDLLESDLPSLIGPREAAVVEHCCLSLRRDFVNYEMKRREEYSFKKLHAFYDGLQPTKYIKAPEHSEELQALFEKGIVTATHIRERLLDYINSLKGEKHD
jgi:hypothetical protein